SSDWNTFALFVNRAATPAVSDPIFGRPLSFYFFILPVLESAAGWLLGISIIGLIAAIFMSVMDVTATYKRVSFGVALVLIALAFQVYLSRYGLLSEQNSLFTGVRYVDEKIVIPGLGFVIASLGLGAAFALANVRAGRIRNLGLA